MITLFRQGGRRLRWRRVVAVAVSLQLHLAALVYLMSPAQPASRRAASSSGRLPALQLRFHHAPARTRSIPAPTITPPARRGPLRAVRKAPPSVSPATVNVAAKLAPALLLYTADGAIRMPPRANTPRIGRDPTRVDMRHFQQLPCHGTRFSDLYARGQDESLGDEVARKYLSWIGLYNRHSQQTYRKRRAWHDRACAP